MHRSANERVSDQGPTFLNTAHSNLSIRFSIFTEGFNGLKYSYVLAFYVTMSSIKQSQNLLEKRRRCVVAKKIEMGIPKVVPNMLK